MSATSEPERNPYDLSAPESYLVADAPEEMIEGFATPRENVPEAFVDAIRVGLLALHRWGEDLARGAGSQRYAAFEDALTESVAAVGVSRGVLHEVAGTTLEERAEEVVSILERENGVDRNDLVGGVVELVPEDELDAEDVEEGR